MVSVCERISFRFFQAFCFPCCRVLFVRFYTSLLAKCRLLSFCLPISIAGPRSFSFFDSPVHLIHIFVTLIWPWTPMCRLLPPQPDNIVWLSGSVWSGFYDECREWFLLFRAMTAWSPVMIVMWMSCPSFKLLGSL